MSRLNLNFNLNSVEERRDFIQKYTDEWKYSPFTEDELQMMGNYILWGKNPDTGKNVVQEKEIQIATKNSHWQSSHEEESLDALLETPTFNEGSIVQPKQTPYRIPRESFSREKALAAAPSSIYDSLVDLFQRIDTLDLIINYYDLNSGKRIKPPREELLEKFSDEEKEKFQEIAKNWNQRKYLQNRHLLIELRKEQYTIRDTYMPIITRHTARVQEQIEDLSIFEDIQIYPLGLFQSNIFQDFGSYDPGDLNEKELRAISDYIHSIPKKRQKLYFDFCDQQSIHELIMLYSDAKEEQERGQALRIPGYTSNLVQTLDFYINNADISQAQRDILNMKINKVPNEDIAEYINSKYKKSYTTNYISTIYRQKILAAICEAAQMHKDIIENIFFPENFKRCNNCGLILLKDNRNFVKKSRAKDQLANKCKRCDKKDRENKKLITYKGTQIAAD